MMHQNAVRFGKVLLLVGICLSALVVLETRQEMVEALELKEDSVRLKASSAEPASAEPASVESQISQVTPAASSTSAQPSTLAVNTETRDVASGPVPQLDPSELPINEWSGASFPVEDFQIYTSPFGYRRSPTGGYTQEFHYGLDMAAPEGSYIRNWWSGKVVEVSDNSNCGTSVVVESGSWLHIYCHMQGHVETANGDRYMIDRGGGIQIREGQDLPAGTRIGRVGMTGRTTGPHLHWGLKFDENWVDPALVLRAMYAGQQSASGAQ